MERRAITVHGVVQGVGFRPFVSGLASRLQLSGFVKNRMGSVLIEVEGDAHSLDLFLAEVASKPPPLARIDKLAWEPRPAEGERQFRIQASDGQCRNDLCLRGYVNVCRMPQGIVESG